MDHLRYSGLPDDRQRVALEAILRADPVVWPMVEKARDLALPDWMIVSGALYNTVWNALTDTPSGHGIKDVDLFYHDQSDLSWEAEDAVLKRAQAYFSPAAIPVEIRNQARVHLWYPQRFGRSCPPYESSAHSLRFFASKTHAVGVSLDTGDRLTILAPFGLDDIFSFRVTPNRALDNRTTHEEKGERAQRNWPQVTLVPW